MTELGKIEGCDRKAFESWDREKKAVVVPGDGNWPQKARVEMDRIGEAI